MAVLKLPDIFTLSFFKERFYFYYTPRITFIWKKGRPINTLNNKAQDKFFPPKISGILKCPQFIMITFSFLLGYIVKYFTLTQILVENIHLSVLSLKRYDILRNVFPVLYQR